MEPKNLELDISVAKNGQFHDFLRQTANSAAWRENLYAAVYCWL